MEASTPEECTGCTASLQVLRQQDVQGGTDPNRRPILILGPTSSGKTYVALRIARQMNWAIINSDKHFSFRLFSTGEDLEDFPRERTALYQFLEACDEPLPPPKYTACVLRAIERFAALGMRSIVHGCTPSYNMMLLNVEPRPITFGMRVNNVEAFRWLVLRRVLGFFEDETIGITRQALVEGMSDCYAFRNSCVFPTMAKYVTGSLTRSQAVQELVEQILQLEAHHRESYSMCHVKWIDFDPEHPDLTVRLIFQELVV